jgi:aspartyl-tRNA(Asn)/glutamyl-tRNA(Gln) amidotransferase subunit C
MADPISSELFNRLVELAALELDADEADYLRAELNKQLKSIDELAAIPVDDDTPIISHGVPYAAAIRPALRPDQWDASAISGDILSQAPQADDGYFVVPDIPKEDLE